MNTHPPSDFGRKVADEYERIKDSFHTSINMRTTKPDGAIIEQVNADLDHLIEKNKKG